jgi:hypothetical protein
VSGVFNESLDEVKSLVWLVGVERLLQQIAGKSLKVVSSPHREGMASGRQYDVQKYTCCLTQILGMISGGCRAVEVVGGWITSNSAM